MRVHKVTEEKNEKKNAEQKQKKEKKKYWVSSVSLHEYNEGGERDAKGKNMEREEGKGT